MIDIIKQYWKRFTTREIVVEELHEEMLHPADRTASKLSKAYVREDKWNNWTKARVVDELTQALAVSNFATLENITPMTCRKIVEALITPENIKARKISLKEVNRVLKRYVNNTGVVEARQREIIQDILDWSEMTGIELDGIKRYDLAESMVNTFGYTNEDEINLVYKICMRLNPRFTLDSYLYVTTLVIPDFRVEYLVRNGELYHIPNFGGIEKSTWVFGRDGLTADKLVSGSAFKWNVPFVNETIIFDAEDYESDAEDEFRHKYKVLEAAAQRGYATKESFTAMLADQSEENVQIMFKLIATKEPGDFHEDDLIENANIIAEAVFIKSNNIFEYRVNTSVDERLITEGILNSKMYAVDDINWDKLGITETNTIKLKDTVDPELQANREFAKELMNYYVMKERKARM